MGRIIDSTGELRFPLLFINRSMNKVYLAFYRSDHENSRFMDRLISRVTNSVYSHVELVYDMAIDYHDGRCYSSSPRDGGVRSKHITLPRIDGILYPLEHT